MNISQYLELLGLLQYFAIFLQSLQHTSIATGSGQSGYLGQMGHFFSRSCGSLGQAQIIQVYNTL